MPALGEVHAVAWPVVNTHLRHAFADRLAVAEVAVLGAVNARLSRRPENQRSNTSVESMLFMLSLYPLGYTG